MPPFQCQGWGEAMAFQPKLVIPLGNKREALSHYQAWQDACEHPLDIDDETRAFLAAVFCHSPFLRDCALKEHEFLTAILTGEADTIAQALINEVGSLGRLAESEAEVMARLRIAKRRMALLCGMADLAGLWEGNTVTAVLSRFADACVFATIDHLLLALNHAGNVELASTDEPQKACGLVILGMGKLGAFELNYSSDIDLILFFDEDCGMKILHDDPHTILTRFAKGLVKLLQERTADGYVFRTDLRLRPDPSSTPPVIPVEAALNYYEGQGQNWERSAMIKARAIAGDLEAANRFLKDLSPFVWRKYLDFNAINDVQSIKRQIHAHKGHGEIAVYGHNVKLGRGGIREIEFFAQTQQLIAGGRNEALRSRETITALSMLSQAGWVTPEAVDELTQAYWYLRAVEHRIQMVRDEQTHLLPSSKEELSGIAALMGEKSVARFEEQLRKTLRLVEKHYSGLFEHAPSLSDNTGNLVFTGEEDDPETLNVLSSMGFATPQKAMQTVKRWHVAKVPALRTTKARELLTELVPFLLQAFSKTQEPDVVLDAFDEFVAGLPAGIQLFSILKSNPDVALLLVRILDSAPRLAEQISRKPHVFDLLLDAGSMDFSDEGASFYPVLETLTRRAAGFEEFLDVIRQVASEGRFGIGTKLFSGEIGWSEAADDYSVLAQMLISICFERVCEEFAKQHGRIEGARICVLAMGRLGSQELTATSDLDLIFLYDVEPDAQSTGGPRPLDATLYHARLIQRFITAMTAPTAEGILYQLDFRLRPSGNAGPLATSVASFLKYQKSDAWVWEAQALTRARPVFGDPALCREIVSGISDVLHTASTKHDLKPEIVKMRKLIDKEKGERNPWNVKLVRGGLLDIEFIAQWMVLAHPHHYVGITSTQDVLKTGIEKEVLPDECKTLLEALSLYSTVLHLGRTCLGDVTDRGQFPNGFEGILCQRLDMPSCDQVEAFLKSTQEAVTGIFNTILVE